jgi:hypothetical protein
MSKSTIDKGHIHQSLASKIWKQVKRHFHKTEEPPVTDQAISAIQHDLALLDEDLDVRAQPSAQPSQEYTEFEVEITLDELQDALALLEQQNEKLMSADDALKQLIDTLKKSETPVKSLKESSQKPEMEVVVEFIPLPAPAPTSRTSMPMQQNPIYQEIRQNDMNEKLKKEKEQRELAKKITHYPPSDRLH